MTPRPVLMLYCQHSLGMGHFVRSIALATGLTERFRVIFLNGGVRPAGITWPQSIEMIDLPPLGMTPDGSLVSHDARYTVDSAQASRQQHILDMFHIVRPQVLLIELFPFGRKKFAAELLPLLDAAQAMRPLRPLILCSLRDILVGRQRQQQTHDEYASTLAQQYFDAILVHADPTFVRLEESFQPRSPLRVPVHYTGFVSTDARPAPLPLQDRRRQVVVSAGGGIVGEPLLQAAIAAQALLWPTTGLHMQVVAGPLFPETAWHTMHKAVSGRPGLELQRFVPNLGAELGTVMASISQCGYNTALDILRAQVPALVVPFTTEREDEQMRRARRLAQLGAIRVLDPKHLDGPTMAAEIEALLHFTPRIVTLDLQGAHNTTQLIETLVQEHHRQGSLARVQSA